MAVTQLCLEYTHATLNYLNQTCIFTSYTVRRELLIVSVMPWQRINDTTWTRRGAWVHLDGYTSLRHDGCDCWALLRRGSVRLLLPQIQVVCDNDLSRAPSTNRAEKISPSAHCGCCILSCCQCRERNQRNANPKRYAGTHPHRPAASTPARSAHVAVLHDTATTCKLASGRRVIPSKRQQCERCTRIGTDSGHQLHVACRDTIFLVFF